MSGKHCCRKVQCKKQRVTAWCLRFCRSTVPKKEGKPLKSEPLRTEELAEADSCWIRREQTDVNLSSKKAKQLVSQPVMMVSCGALEELLMINEFSCQESTYATRICEDAHRKVGHEQVNFMMATIRSEFWIPW